MIDTREMTFQFSIIKKNKNYNIAMQCDAMRCNATQCDAMRRNASQCVAKNNPPWQKTTFATRRVACDAFEPRNRAFCDALRRTCDAMRRILTFLGRSDMAWYDMACFGLTAVNPKLAMPCHATPHQPKTCQHAMEPPPSTQNMPCHASQI